jgi:hypothetical protein
MDHRRQFTEEQIRNIFNELKNEAWWENWTLKVNFFFVIIQFLTFLLFRLNTSQMEGWTLRSTGLCPF